jgi:hypothetical protein
MNRRGRSALAHHTPLLVCTACSTPHASSSQPMTLRGRSLMSAAPDSVNAATMAMANQSPAPSECVIPGRAITSPESEIGIDATSSSDRPARTHPVSTRVRSSVGSTLTIRV